ncbi:MAG TPA: glycosyltransferase family 4 protein [Methylococcales bacterium]|jgi:glycosyltransferase involved in cell wall biosynthesis
MKLCLVGTASPPDEARKVMAHNLLPILARKCEVMLFDMQRLLSVDEWQKAKAFKPDVLHVVTSASPFSFLLARILQRTSKTPKTVMFSSLIPFRGFSAGLWFGLSSLFKPVIPLLKPDLVLAQSDEAEAIYSRLGCNVMPFVYSGVDLKRFHPVSTEEKEDLRAKYGVEPDKFVVLHVGPVKKSRNLECLRKIQGDSDNQVLLVGRPATKYEREVADVLRKAGVVVTQAYNPRIEEFYALSDCYIFPTTDAAGSIDIPLSVLEALACGLPVISTRFGGLPRIFSEADGFCYADVEEFPDRLKALKSQGAAVKTRELVFPYSWENIARNLVEVYEQMLQ